MSEGLNQIEQVTQDNTANAEQSSAAAEELSDQARLLDEMTNRFTIDRGSTRSLALPSDAETGDYPQV